MGSFISALFFFFSIWKPVSEDWIYGGDQEQSTGGQLWKHRLQRGKKIHNLLFNPFFEREGYFKTFYKIKKKQVYHTWYISNSLSIFKSTDIKLNWIACVLGLGHPRHCIQRAFQRIVKTFSPNSFIFEEKYCFQIGLTVKLYDSGESSRWYMINLLGEPLGMYHKIETLKILNIYISACQAIIRSFM